MRETHRAQSVLDPGSEKSQTPPPSPNPEQQEKQQDSTHGQKRVQLQPRRGSLETFWNNSTGPSKTWLEANAPVDRLRAELRVGRPQGPWPTLAEAHRQPKSDRIEPQ